MLGQEGGRQLFQHASYFIDDRPTHRRLAGYRLDDLDTSFVAGGQGLRQQFVDIKYLDIVVAQDLDKAVVLFLGALHPQDVVKQQLVMVRGGRPAQAQIGPMDYDLSQLPTSE